MSRRRHIKSILLPAAYQELSYVTIQGTNTKINTGLTVNMKIDKFETAFMLLNKTNTFFPHSSGTYGSTLYSIGVMAIGNGSFNSRYLNIYDGYGGYGFSGNIEWQINTLYTIVYDKNSYTMNGTQYTYGNTARSAAVTQSISVGTGEQVRVYKYAYYSNGILLGYLIPCKRLSDNKVGFYNTYVSSFITDNQISI